MKLKTLEMLENRYEPMTVKELAKVLGDSQSHIYRRIHNGEIKGVFRDGWLIKIWPSGAAEWLKGLTAQGSCPRRRRAKPSPEGQHGVG
jgi:excisionase family DNA binding protein